MSMNDHKSAVSVEFGVTDKCYQAGEFANREQFGLAVHVDTHTHTHTCMLSKVRELCHLKMSTLVIAG